MVSLINPAFDNSESILSQDISNDWAHNKRTDKVVYTNVDERSSVEASPIYIREGGIRYTTTTPPMDEASINYSGGGGDSGAACLNFVTNPADDDTLINASFLIVRKMHDDGVNVFVEFAEMIFEDGCLVKIVNETNHTLNLERKLFTICGGSTTEVVDVESATDFMGTT